jgi:hypothetical protein
MLPEPRALCCNVTSKLKRGFGTDLQGAFSYNFHLIAAGSLSAKFDLAELSAQLGSKP